MTIHQMMKRLSLTLLVCGCALATAASSVRGDGMIPFLAITGKPTEAEVRAKEAVVDWERRTPDGS